VRTAFSASISWRRIRSSFLKLRGYGVSNQAARIVVTKIEGAGCTLEHMQRELEKLALVM